MTARKSWTLRQAMAANARFVAAGGSEHDVTGPIYQWGALKRLDELREQYHAGELGALMAAVGICATHRLVMPDWVSEGFVRCYARVLACEVPSWDDAFGRPLGKGKSLGAAHRRLVTKWPVFNAVTRYHEQGRAIDESLFQTVGEKYAISAGTARDYYYDAKQKLADFMQTYKNFPKHL